MGLEEIIALAFKIGASAIPKVVALITDLRGGVPPSQAEVDEVWARHRAAFDTIVNEDASTHPGIV